MRINIPYGKGSLPLEVEPRRLAAVLEPKHETDKPVDERAMVQQALMEPIGSPLLCDLAVGKRRVLVITSDHTRPMPSSITLPLLLSEIRKGSPGVEIIILIATGTHRPMTEAEMRQRFGDALVDHENIVNHRCGEDDQMVFKGLLPSGGELWLNKLIDWGELIVSEGFIEPHFFAGFSGGRKSVLPGIAARKTVLYNHNAGFLKNPAAVSGSLLNNPLHRDMLFAAREARLAFILNVVLDGQKRIAYAVCGDPEKAHAAGCDRCHQRTRVQRTCADIAVTGNGGYPLDQNIYQCVKGMTAGEACVRPGGVIILCAALGDGPGGEAFFKWLSEAESARAVAEAIEGIPADETREDQWEAQILARVLLRATVIFVTGAENKAIVEAMHMRYAESLPEAMRIAEGIVGADATVVAIPDGVGVIIR